MLQLDLDPTLADGRTVFVQEEPALEIALPQVFDQPPLTTLQRGRIPNAEALVARIYRTHQEDPARGLGADYQELVTEFAPLFAWAMASWDFLLTTEGCRFLLRQGEQKWNARGDYRVVTDKDFSRMVHAVFRHCVLEFAQAPMVPSLARWLREQFWTRTVEVYRRLEQPADSRQRPLTPYSYLRCVPYAFLNEYHQDLVYTVVRRLPQREWEAIDAYFLHFFTEAATAQTLGVSEGDGTAFLRQGLLKLLVSHRLVYCLLRQIERY